jgi:hypothetical protein
LLEALRILATLARIALGLLGIGALVVSGYALSKLGTASLDSPRWMFVVTGGLGLVAGVGLVWYAVRGFRPPASSSRT